MNVLTAHALIALVPLEDRPELSCMALLADDRADPFPATATALASLSGMLEDCQPDDLLEAVAHGSALASCGILSLEDVQVEVEAVIDAVLSWGDAVTARGKERV